MKGKFGIIIAALVIGIIAVGGVLLNYNLDNTMHHMQFIESRYRGGRFIDNDQSICVESADDIGWWKEGDKWVIKFGKIELNFTPSNLKDEKFLEQAGRIGLDIRGNLEEGNLKFYWQGTELKEWVPS